MGGGIKTRGIEGGGEREAGGGSGRQKKKKGGGFLFGGWLILVSYNIEWFRNKIIQTNWNKTFNNRQKWFNSGVKKNLIRWFRT